VTAAARHRQCDERPSSIGTFVLVQQADRAPPAAAAAAASIGREMKDCVCACVRVALVN
jgi:hypothetical protein